MNKTVLWCVLALAALATGGYWTYYAIAARAELAAVQADTRAAAEAAAAGDRAYYCPKCQQNFMVPVAEVEKLAREGDKVRCRNCRQMSATEGAQAPKGAFAP